MKNLEIKVEVKNLDEIKNRLSFTVYEKTLEQVDTYFLLGDTKIKTREEKDSREIIVYFRKIKKGTRESRYYRQPLSSLSVSVVKKISDYILGTKVTVVKKRDLYIYKNTRIHVDTVENLGNFIELETVCHDLLSENEYQNEHEEVKQILALSQYRNIPGSYSDLLCEIRQKTQ